MKTLASPATPTPLSRQGQEHHCSHRTYTLTVDLEALTLDIQGEATFTAPDLYLLGDFNEWTASDAYKMTSNGEVNEDGNVIYTYSASAISGAYKIGSADWSVSLGAADANGAGTFELQRSGMDNNLKADLINATFTLTYPKDITKAPVLVVNGFRKGVRKAFAYEVKGAVVENDNYKVTFKATEPQTKATLSSRTPKARP